MFIPNPGDDILAVDARTGDLIWEYKRKLPEGVRRKTNRTMAMWGTTLINSSSDNFIYALDMATGKLVWETRGARVRRCARRQAAARSSPTAK